MSAARKPAPKAPASKGKASSLKPVKPAKKIAPKAKAVAAKSAKPAPKAKASPVKPAKPAPKPAAKSAPKPAAKPTPKSVVATKPKNSATAAKPKPGSASAKPAAGAPKLKVLGMIMKKKAGGAAPVAGAKPVAALKPAAAKPAPAAAPAPANDKKAMLARLLAMRAEDTLRSGKKAARDVRQTGSANNVHLAPAPTSVHKAAEFAETRKITSIVKKSTSAKAKPAAEPPPGPTEAELAERRARRRKAPYAKTEVKELREILESERARLLRDLAVINDVAASSEEDMSRSFSSHQADAARDTAALETTFVTRRYEEERLGMVARALERLEDGTYGLCEQCADEPQNLCETCPFIPIGRLRAKPFAAMCVPLRQEYEKRNKR